MDFISQFIDKVVTAVSDFFASNPELANSLVAMLFVGFFIWVFLYDDDEYDRHHRRAGDRYHGYGERGRYSDSWENPSERGYRQGYNDAYRDHYDRRGW